MVDLGGPVAYREWEGPGETTFVLVHGLGGSHLNWIQVAPELAGLGRVYALDLPGFGCSPRAGRGSRLMDERRVLSRFVETLGSESVVLCGNSMGGGIGILQAAVEPQSIHGLVLTDAILPWARGGWPRPVVVGAFGAYEIPWVGEGLLNARLRRMTPERSVALGFRLTMADPRAIPPEIVDLHVELARQRRGDPDAAPSFLEAARSIVRLGRKPAIAHRALDAVRCPVLVLHGRRDRLVPVAFAEAALERHPTWRGRFFPDLGHAPQMEAPGRWLAEVADWHAELLE